MVPRGFDLDGLLSGIYVVPPKVRRIVADACRRHEPEVYRRNAATAVKR
ncbi:MAG: hypothetical protein QNJ91_10975 [Gammaproteobacteria bacterium]|nr:hypothetical protein [Gammaproteobacteria bacterium]